MHNILKTSLLVLVTYTTMLCQQTETTEMNVSFSASSGIFLLPFTAYNTSSKNVSVVVRTDPYYVEPQGKLETIHAIPEYTFRCSYIFSDGWRVATSVSYSTIQANWNFHPKAGSVPLLIYGSPAFEQTTSSQIPCWEFI